jgi:Na+/H+ antiporter NhaD/arsenite permease-like protein
LVYLALAIGYLPGFGVDRTGAAVVGGLAMVGLHRITPQAAWMAIDYQTIGLLFGLMVVSGAFTISGFYGWAAARVASLRVSPPVLLALLIPLGGGLSSVLTNDVVVVAMTPLLVSITMSRGLNPVPFLLGFCFASNTGATATLVGSPQNMIVAQALGLSFLGFTKATLLPALISLPLVWGVIALLYRRRWTLNAKTEPVAPPTLDVPETIKAAIVTVVVIGAFILSDWPRELTALMAAGIILVNRKVSKVSSKEVLSTVDGNLLLLLAGLFVVNAALAQTGLPQHVIHVLQGAGVDFSNPSILFLVCSALSNTVGNNPAVMLLTPFLPHSTDHTAIGAALALGTGFSSNLIIFGSLAGIIVLEQAAERGVKITMAEFCRAGVPVTVLSGALALVWLTYLSV